jgi:hypothetical protein
LASHSVIWASTVMLSTPYDCFLKADQREDFDCVLLSIPLFDCFVIVLSWYASESLAMSSCMLFL